VLHALAKGVFNPLTWLHKRNTVKSLVTVLSDGICPRTLVQGA
jgi:hypothetical protein